MPFLGGFLIDVGDGTVISPPPAAPFPVLPVASPPVAAPVLVAPPMLPPAAVVAPGYSPSTPILPPGNVYFDGGDGTLINPATGEPVTSPPAPTPPAFELPPSDDFSDVAATVEGWDPDLSDLPAWGLDDPFATRSLAAANPPLKGGGAVEALTQACSTYGIDPLACFANVLHEGWQGAIGDGGLAYGPTQNHLTEFVGRPFYGKGRNNDTVNAWAWSRNGIEYQVRGMASGSPSARGLTGHQAVYAIVYGYEKPKDKPGAYLIRAAEYDRLNAMGTGVWAYLATQMHGPVAGGATDPGLGAPKPEPPAAYVPAGVNAQWRDLIGVLGTTIPEQHDKVKSFGLTLKDVFK